MLHSNKERAIHAVKQNGFAVSFLSAIVRKDEEFMITAIKPNRKLSVEDSSMSSHSSQIG